MHSNFDNTRLQLQEIESNSNNRNDNQNGNPNSPKPGAGYDAGFNESWVSAFNTSLLTTRANHIKDRSNELGELMQSAEFKSLLIAAQHLAHTQGYSKEEATERLIEIFRKIDFSWKQLVMNRGMKSLIGE
ncbi:MAG: hypothetical protein JST80_07700 [Bdellovibrionales bacterium]|nr:hypothetical protein [Bdellovibrionales bacterium]